MRKGFTLIELLVVVAIIALLLAIMAPTVSSMIERTKRVGCENNHHQIILALTQYQADNRGYMCWPNWLGPESANIWTGPGWLYNYALTGTNWTPQARQNGSLWPYIQQQGTYRCPLHEPPYPGSSAITSYLMNGAVIEFGAGWTSSPPTGPLYRVQEMNPMSIIFWEAEENPDWPGADWNDGSSYPGEGLTQRHKDGATFGCADGHTEYMTRDQFVAETNRRPGMLWCNPCSGSF